MDGGDSGDIAQVILDNKAGGIETYGSESEIVNDSEGNPTTINFSRITQVELYFIVNLVTNSDYPVDGDDTVKSLLAEYINGLDRNEDVLNWKLDGSFIDVEGITGVTSILMGTVDPPVSSANISIGANERAVTEVANITVNS